MTPDQPQPPALKTASGFHVSSCVSNTGRSRAASGSQSHTRRAFIPACPALAARPVCSCGAQLQVSAGSFWASSFPPSLGDKDLTIPIWHMQIFPKLSFRGHHEKTMHRHHHHTKDSAPFWCPGRVGNKTVGRRSLWPQTTRITCPGLGLVYPRRIKGLTSVGESGRSASEGEVTANSSYSRTEPVSDERKNIQVTEETQPSLVSSGGC